MKQSSGQSSYQRQQKGGTSKLQGQAERVRNTGRKETYENEKSRLDGNVIDSVYGFNLLQDGGTRLGWLLNHLEVTMPNELGIEKSGLELFFIDRNRENFKALVFFEPYFYIDVRDASKVMEVSAHVQRKFEGSVRVEMIDKEDLEMANHLSGKQHRLVKLICNTVNEMNDVRRTLRPHVLANQKQQSLETESPDSTAGSGGTVGNVDPFSYVTDMREYDVPYQMRVAIDTELRVGAWFNVTPIDGSQGCQVSHQKDMMELCDPKVLAFDIECEKDALKFPNSEKDRIFMISYMISGQGYLIINRELVSEDVSDFEYTPLPKYPGLFHVFNVETEEELLRKFLDHIRELKPHVMVTYNGDSFDWPYVDHRCKLFNISMYHEIGVKSTKEGATPMGGRDQECEYRGRCVVHLDAFKWVQRDSYLPQGCQGLKAVTKAKLGYDPVEVDPEDMVRYAVEKPAHMASYSVSDAVATYYLYTTYVHNFIFSMCTVIPLVSEDVLRKGSGTLCEALLMVEAFRGNIICPNKQMDPIERFHEGRLLDNDTYIGGHVECLEAGVFRADIPAKFSLVPSALQQLINHIDRDLCFVLETEHDVQRSDISNYDEIKQSIVQSLEMLRDTPNRVEAPLIYHLDVGAMYPNIILTNRLQPGAIVSQRDCASCDFNRAENQCKREMAWTWRGEYSPASSSEYMATKRQLTYEKIDDKPFTELTERTQAELVKNRLKLYSHRVYKKTKITEIAERNDTVCMRENPFYVNTVRAFRDRRYDYKLLTKQYKGQVSEALKKGDAIGRKVAEDKAVLMDSLQLAHKCILNSFYGYVMRKGARWRSMEMAGIVTHTGALLIKQARELVEQVGRPLELDTDGIWAILPMSFPQDYNFITKNGKKIHVGYPCAMLNADVHERYTNLQYQDLVNNPSNNSDPNESFSSGHGSAVAQRQYATHSECSIYFELDGPYRAMILPASPEEGKLLKKKYVVFNFDGSTAELKGFELKRRGELEIIKIFQSQVFDQFLAGANLQECYNAVGAIGNRWLDILDSNGMGVDDDELLELISERKTISKRLDEYEGRKATSLTTAERLSDFLGAEMVKDKGLNCNLIISVFPRGAPVTERAIPVAIFSADEATRDYFLRKWLKEPHMDCSDFRCMVDWTYYKERLGRSIQKIITIPAGLQRMDNPCPRVVHPPWLQKIMVEKMSGLKQMTMSAMFKSKSSMPSANKLLIGAAVAVGADKSLTAQSSYNHMGSHSNTNNIVDMEDMFNQSAAKATKKAPRTVELLDEDGSPIDDSGTDEVLEHSPVRVLPLSEYIPTDQEEMHQWLEARKKSWTGARRKTGSGTQRKYGVSIQDTLRGFNPQDEDDEVEYDESGNKKKKIIGVTDLIRNAALSVTHGYWQIVELYETGEVPGEFVVWAMTSKTQLQKISLVIPRTFYVNCRGKAAEEVAISMAGCKVIRDLPHGRPCMALYEVCISERRYLRSEKNLNLFLCDPEVEGVYETEVPLWFRGVMKMGSVARMSSAAVGKKDIQLNDLELVNDRNHPYLTEHTANFRKIFMYTSSDKTRDSGHGMIAVFILDNLSSSVAGEEFGEVQSVKCYVWLSTNNNFQDNKPPMQRLLKKYCKDEVYNKMEVQFIIVNTISMTDSWLKCNERLSQYVRERRGPTVITLQGAFETAKRKWRILCPVLNDFPLVTMPFNGTDDLFPALNWQMFAAIRVIQRFIIFPVWFSDRLECARASHIPISNLGNNVTMVMTDILFARQLHQNRHLLWATEANRPDCGGAKSTDLVNSAVWSDVLKEPVINECGAFRNVCVELEIHGLAINAIMFSHLLDPIGLSSLANTSGSNNQNKIDGDASHASTTGSTDTSCGRAFMLLKALVAKWFNDLGAHHDAHADYLLLGLYRYLSSHGDALLHDAALHRVIYGLMIKLFKTLIGEFRKLGAHVVYATFDKIIIHTNKVDHAAAMEYSKFLVDTVISRDMFQSLQIQMNPEKVHHWDQLLWLGPDNWSGGSVSIVSHEDLVPVRDEEEIITNQFYGLSGLGEEGARSAPQKKKRKSKKKKVSFMQKNEMGMYDLIDSDDEGVDRKNAEYDFLDNSSEGTQSVSDSGEMDDFDDYYGEGEVEQFSERVYDATTTRRSSSKVEDVHEGYEEEPKAVHDQEDDHMYSRYEHIHLLGEDESNVIIDEQVVGLRKLDLDGHWNLASYLPLEVSNKFLHIVTEYLRLYATKLTELQEASHNANNTSLDDSLQNAAVPRTEAEVVAAVLTYMKDTIKGRLTDMMLDIVDEIRGAYMSPDVARASFPQLPGAKGPRCNPALEFVKATCHVMGLDTSLWGEVSALRRTLLTQLKVREFNVESEFEDPCTSYLLRDVICSFCNKCRDIDLLRDAAVITFTDDRAPVITCTHCNHYLSTIEIENRLIEEVDRMSTGYLLQDFRCPTTHKAAVRMCAAQSDLSKPLTMDVTSEQFNGQLDTLKRVGTYHHMEWLLSVISQHSQTSGV